ncbi:ABC transporter ATP-binding protein [Acidovorax lacteus]
MAAHSAPHTAPVLQVQQVSKGYRLYAHPRQRLRALLTGAALHTSHWALRDVSFALRPGQCLGVVGNNGAGKSTLLKLLAGTLQPTQGTVQCQGRVTAILELGAGFHPDFSGRDNLRFAGSLMGLDAATIARLEASIIDFAELGHAIDRAVKTYSSGMVVRLAFALVTAVQPELLIVDEALAVGDQNFQKKCVERIEAFRRNGCTILFCSHSLYHVRQLCDVALWLDKGQVRSFGDTEKVLAAYEASLRQQDVASEQEAAPSQPLPVAPAAGGDTAHIVSVQVAHLDAASPPQLQSKDLAVTVRARSPESEPPSVGIMLEQAHGVGITSIASHVEQTWPRWNEAEQVWEITLTFPDLPLHTGEYVLSAYLFDHKGLVVCDEWKHCQNFLFVYPTQTPGLVRLPHVWS